MARLYICDNCGAQRKATPGLTEIITDYSVPYFDYEENIINFKKQDVCMNCLRKIAMALDYEKYTVVEWSQVKRPYTRNTKKSAATQEDNE